MEVSHVADHVTHAVIGGDQAIELSMTDNAQFMIMMPSTLYSDQKLAVIREVLCNAWDAHIDAGVTDKAIKITIDDEHLIIQDFGYGIPRNMMGSIYGTYGNSTKKNDGKQTGGFGLGSKAPYAYTDNFEVISANQGTKTIYRMSKSSASVQGKPGMTPIAEFPTTESGMTIKIPLVSSKDQSYFSILVQRITANGGMNVVMNDKPVPTLPFDRMEHGFMITTEPLLSNAEHTILVRYGNVIYPLESHEKFASLFTFAQKTLINLRSASHYSYRNNEANSYRLVLQADPNTISVTPSRESLSMQEFTINAVNILLQNFCDHVQNHRADALHFECLEKQFAMLEKYNSVAYMYDPSREMPRQVIDYKTNGIITGKQPTYLFTQRDVVERTCELRFPEKIEGFYQKNLEMRVQAIIKRNEHNRGLAQSYLRAIQKHDPRYKDPGKWFKRVVLWPLISKVKADKELTLSRLFYSDTRGNYDLYSQAASQFITMDEMLAASSVALADMLPVLRKVIVISHLRGAASEVALTSDIRKKFGKSLEKKYFVYVVPRSDKKIQAALQLFKGMGYHVVDLTSEQHIEVPTPEVKEAKIAAKIKKDKGIPLLKSIQPKDHLLDVDLAQKPGAARVLKPEFVVKLNSRSSGMHYHIGDYDNEASRAIVRLYGHRGGVIISSTQEDKYIREGALSFDDFMKDRIAVDVRMNKELATFFSESPLRLKQELRKLTGGDDDMASMSAALMLRDNPTMRQFLSLAPQLSQTAADLHHVWEDCYNNKAASWRTRNSITPIVEQVRQYICDIPTSESIVLLAKQLVKNWEHIRMLQLSYVLDLMDKRSNPRECLEFETLAKYLSQ